MSRFVNFLLPFFVLGLFVAIMNSGSYLKKPLGKEDNIPLSIQKLKQDVRAQKWAEADRDLDLLLKAWKKVKARVQISEERDQIDALDVNLYRLRGLIDGEDRAEALAEAEEAIEHWENLGG